MKKIILSIVLSSLLPTIAVAEERTMKNTNPTTPSEDPLMSGKHMQNTNPAPTKDPLASGKHMTSTSDDPFSPHAKSKKKTAKTNKETNGSYTVIEYEE